MARYNVDPVKTDDYGYGNDPLDAFGQSYSMASVPPPVGAPVEQPQQKSFPPVSDGSLQSTVMCYVQRARDGVSESLKPENRDLLISKLFYFFFFAAFGSLFPLIAVYFKQLGMNPAQTGLLIGLRPFVELIASPFWGNVAERWKKYKLILLFSLFCWVTFTLSLAYVQPEAIGCLVGDSKHVSFVSRATGGDDHVELLPHPKIVTYGLSPLELNLDDIENLNTTLCGARSDSMVSPPMSAVVYCTRKVLDTFFLLLILQILGEFLSAPSIAMADTATLGYLGDDIENYGRQRMWGSLGWGIAMFIVGIALDHSDVFRNHPCGTKQLVDRNYMTCYAIFSVLMSCAFIIATQFRFKDADGVLQQNIQLSEFKDKVFEQVQAKLANRKPQDSEQPNAASNPFVDQQNVHISLQAGRGQGDMISDVGAAPLQEAEKPTPYVPRGKPGQAGTLPQWVTVLKMFAPIQLSSMFFILWFMGFGMGLAFAFLFWHLQDFGGTPTLFGIASVINHASEILAYFYIRNIVAKFGHLNVIYAGLVGNFMRFIYISVIPGPNWVLVFEFVQGLTHACVWAAGCSYMTQVVPGNMRPTAQMILQMLHHTVGRGCGTIIGGAIINTYGTAATFRGYGIVCLLIVLGYFALNFFYISKLPPIVPPPAEGGSMVDESAYLTPHGVPGGLPHSLSNSRLDKGRGVGDAPQYGTAGPPTLNGYLDPAGNTNQYTGGYAGGGFPARGGGNEDYGYGYDLGPGLSSKVDVTSERGSGMRTRGDRRQDEPTDGVSVRQQFQDYNDAIKHALPPKPTTHRLILDAAPHPATQLYTAQPPSRDVMYDEQANNSGRWLY